MFSSPTKRTLLRMLERDRDTAATERARLIDQILFLSGKTWTPPPASVPDFLPEPDADFGLVENPDHEPAY